MALRKKRNTGIIILLIVLLLAAGGTAFAVSLRITDITYEGNEKCDDEMLEKALFSKDIDKNPFVFLFRSKFKEHKQIPFIEKYEVKMITFTKFKVTVYEKSVIGYLKYMGECMYFDKDGIVVEVTTTELPGIAMINGIEFDHIVVNEMIPVKDKNTFDTILDITQMIDHYQIAVDNIYINKDLEITLYISKVRIELGVDDEQLSERVNDLVSITNVLEDESGVLDMTEYSKNNKGYTFKKDSQ